MIFFNDLCCAKVKATETIVSNVDQTMNVLLFFFLLWPIFMGIIVFDLLTGD